MSAGSVFPLRFTNIPDRSPETYDFFHSQLTHTIQGMVEPSGIEPLTS
jgi:hypothetical protein